ncbi:hypothetical protein CO057_03420 [Candidatus Uhrbacteria bacterium CG_4_9_14_0_2_um_filter_41_50]|uniref:Uncharacterized protein n=1 Tax=Candidatus Uhrbacteria bacterium CG_4_9_14_0_2_um_filter_41_50 TaxID=1975031 RepID=A0A2M8ENN0_9BACT|nr:MAG: hypothetical protein COZ45_02430 [Candidatus Uhrbacteria bacterium CG_4_10_14_3_um_filter_41_21]PIZ54249.1 MAG: hypothetical protein COY24_04535 [Candidatus Uhrbacteria bacterium CG_4_10_14_0_2_um_filter_41_21]PJB84418.1 MAG: hypothetical protein CO086_03620 [Candidatus Uhrbacteria bacterium CG_4_9_14_0_8_um_filter_41_16]PJC24349.1 MAG: hypothetical protein CO057_03420 [Candidatus Uhrbacteria bacterium CG_4_9_14_0_2_um_filter_41_50]PJE75288.1 MAG: hypothetical protein COV03_00785 [Candi
MEAFSTFTGGSTDWVDYAGGALTVDSAVTCASEFDGSISMIEFPKNPGASVSDGWITASTVVSGLTPGNRYVGILSGVYEDTVPYPAYARFQLWADSTILVSTPYFAGDCELMVGVFTATATTVDLTVYGKGSSGGDETAWRAGQFAVYEY